MIEWFRLEGTLKTMELQPCAMADCSPPAEAAQGPIHGPVYLQGWGPTALGSCATASAPSEYRISSLTSSLNLPSVSLKPFPFFSYQYQMV